MQAVIAGGGIGGLTAAICLARIGWGVQVLEQAPAITEIGAGLQLSPNGVKILTALGVMPGLEATLFEPEVIEMRTGRSGRCLFSLPMRRTAPDRWGARYVQIHRADLVEALRARLAELVPDALQTGARVTGYDHRGDRAVAVTEAGRIEADLLIGADGLHSAIRAQMLGPDTPRFTGNLAWRALVPVERLGAHAPPMGGCIWVGPGRHAVTTRVRGGRVANFVGVVERDGWREEGWTHIGDPAAALEDFRDWHPVITTLIAQSDRMLRWALFDRAPLARWSDGPVVLLGDACHPMLPSMAQGAVQAVEDAWVLASILASSDSAEAAGRAYYKARIERTSRVQRGSAKNLTLFHRRTALGQLVSYAPVWLAGHLWTEAIHRRQDWVYGYEPPGIGTAA